MGRSSRFFELVVAMSQLSDRLAEAVDTTGTWLSYPIPGRILRSKHVRFDAADPIERCRQFLIIALGEAVLATGAAVARHLPVL